MSGSNWDTYEEAPAQRKMSVWGKVLIGCGGTVFLLFGSCVGFMYWATHSGRDTVKQFVAEKYDHMMEKPWGMLSGVVDSIQTDEGALTLYRNSPLLKGDFPTEEDFLKNAAVWRSKLVDFPRTPPSFDELKENNFDLSSSKRLGSSDKSQEMPHGSLSDTPNVKFSRRGNRSLEMAYTLPNGTRVRMAWEDNSLAEIDVR